MKWKIYISCFFVLHPYMFSLIILEFESVSLNETLIMDFFLAFITAVFILLSTISPLKKTLPLLYSEFHFLKNVYLLTFLDPVDQKLRLLKNGIYFTIFIIYFRIYLLRF